jgi:DNA modification methylase
MEWTLKTCGIRDGLVIDPFMGSGSMGVACHRAGLRYLGVEIDPEHYATARERLRRETAQGLLSITEKT